ncbi:PAS domain-containing protein, partial [Bacteroidota bacterium]
GKHDETRELLKSALDSLQVKGELSVEELKAIIDLVLKPASDSIADMVMKEEEILFPMCMDKLNDQEWYNISQQSMEYGFCLYDPDTEWKPEGVIAIPVTSVSEGYIQLSTGKLDVEELENILNILPVELTFIDSDDKVKYFSQGKHQLFKRNRAVLGRDVRLCHPPKSVKMVEQIIHDFKSGKEQIAIFWFEMDGKFIHVEYYAVRDDQGRYIGTLEVAQDCSEIRKLKGEQRLVNYIKT